MSDPNNPIYIFFCWQSLVLALAVSGSVQFIKRVLDTRMGVERRKNNKYITRVLLPTLGLFLGALYANIMPVRPEILITYVTNHKESWANPVWGMAATYGGWGAAVGQFADYIFTKVKRLIEAS